MPSSGEAEERAAYSNTRHRGGGFQVFENLSSHFYCAFSFINIYHIGARNAESFRCFSFFESISSDNLASVASFSNHPTKYKLTNSKLTNKFLYLNFLLLHWRCCHLCQLLGTLFSHPLRVVGFSITTPTFFYFYRTQVYLGSDLWVRVSETIKLRESFCRLNWCDSGWWRYQVNTNW